jgi:hypothetical protein
LIGKIGKSYIKKNYYLTAIDGTAGDIDAQHTTYYQKIQHFDFVRFMSVVVAL